MLQTSTFRLLKKREIKKEKRKKALSITTPQDKSPYPEVIKKKKRKDILKSIKLKKKGSMTL